MHQMNPSEIYVKSKILDTQDQLTAMDYSSYFTPTPQQYHFMGLPPTPAVIGPEEFNNGSPQVGSLVKYGFWDINKYLGRIRFPVIRCLQSPRGQRPVPAPHAAVAA
jgi:hypothetical protein